MKATLFTIFTTAAVVMAAPTPQSLDNLGSITFSIDNDAGANLVQTFAVNVVPVPDTQIFSPSNPTFAKFLSATGPFSCTLNDQNGAVIGTIAVGLEPVDLSGKAPIASTTCSGATAPAAPAAL